MASGSSLEEVAPAQNCILEERLPPARENSFLSFNDFEAKLHTRELWFEQHARYGDCRIASPAVSETFTDINQPNWLGLNPDWCVVRLETLNGLVGRANRRGSVLTAKEAERLVRDLLESRTPAEEFDPFQEARLETWMEQVNDGSDRRPAFVAPYADVKDLLEEADWANRLRNALGLGHIRAQAGNSAIVLLMQYNLKRVYDAHFDAKAWAATPTILDDVPGNTPNVCFFPAPRSATDEYGYTVDLSDTGPSCRREFLHGHIGYELDDIRRIGEVTTDIPPAKIAEARARHRNLLADDLVHLGDLP